MYICVYIYIYIYTKDFTTAKFFVHAIFNSPMVPEFFSRTQRHTSVPDLKELGRPWRTIEGSLDIMFFFPYGWLQNPAPPKGWLKHIMNMLKPYKSGDFAHLSTGAGFPNHPQY